MAVTECIVKLVATGRITREIGDEAQALYERSKGEFQRDMGPAQSEAAAGLAAARAMEAGAKKLKTDAAKQALAWASFEKTALEHPDGPVAGVLDQLSQSLRGRGTRNVDTVREDIWNRLAGMFGDAMTHYAPGITGVSKDQIASARKLIHEIFGHATGDQKAGAFGRAWADIRKYGEDRARAAGRNFEPNEDWRLPQPWQSEQVRKVPASEFMRDFQTEMENGGIKRLWDRDTGKPVAAGKEAFILERAYNDIISSGGSVGTFAREMRTFEFGPGEAGADAWLRLQQKYGVGDNLFGMMTGHMNRMATEIALSEVIAPNHRAAIAAMMPRLRAHEAQMTTLQRFNPTRMLESRSLVQKTYDVLTGRANAVEGPLVAGILGGMRSISTAAQLKGAIISSVPGDTVTSILAAQFNGMPAGRLVSGVVRELSRGGQESRALAARLNLTAHSAMEYGHGYRFFQDQIAGPSQLRWLATTMIRAQGLEAWTELVKRTFSMEMAGHLADHTGHDLASLRGANRQLADFLDRYQIGAADWDAIRAAPLSDVNGATFIDTSAIADQKLAEKLRTGIIQERRYAMLEPDARVRGVTTGGLPQGTFLGEVSRNLFLFKSFSLTMAATHVMRIATNGPIESRIWNASVFTLYSAIAGSLAMQAKNIIYGKDPESMTNPTFWAKAFLQGGGVGIYGDLVNSAFSRSGRSPVADFGGPVVGAVEDLTRLTSGQLRKAYEGKDSTLGGEVVRTLKRYTPGTFYTKLAVDRLMFDQLQTMIDKDYRGSFRRIEDRMKRDNKQEFWFRPGETVPQRGPNFGPALQ